jgi:DNA (cytosine-5)-methyltransferase 1
MKPRLLVAFCGAGGDTAGWQRAGFHVTGVDLHSQPNYCGDVFVQADALSFLRTTDLSAFNAIVGGPPCQAYSDLQKQNKREYPRLIEPFRAILRAWGGPYVIENVEGAPLVDPIMLCGTMFHGLRVIRHRLFESNFPIAAPAHPKHPLVFTHDKRKAHYGQLDQDTSFVMVNGGGNCTVANKRSAMGVPWMTGAEANEAIPPAYAEYIGTYLMREVQAHRKIAA